MACSSIGGIRTTDGGMACSSIGGVRIEDGGIACSSMGGVRTEDGAIACSSFIGLAEPAVLSLSSRAPRTEARPLWRRKLWGRICLEGLLYLRRRISAQVGRGSFRYCVPVSRCHSVGAHCISSLTSTAPTVASAPPARDFLAEPKLLRDGSSPRL